MQEEAQSISENKEIFAADAPLSAKFEANPQIYKRRSYSRENPPDYEWVSKRPEYWAFVYWSATFEPNRDPKSHGALAEQLHLNQATLSHWKLMPQFAEDVIRNVKENMKLMAPNVMQGWAYRIPKDGSAADARFFAEFVLGFKSAQRYESDSRLDVYFKKVDLILHGKVSSDIQVSDDIRKLNLHLSNIQLLTIYHELIAKTNTLLMTSWGRNYAKHFSQ
jgi:hypothetical protein